MAPLPPPTQAGVPLQPPWSTRYLCLVAAAAPRGCRGASRGGGTQGPLARPRLVPARSFGCLMETGFKGKAARTFPKKIINGLW